MKLQVETSPFILYIICIIQEFENIWPDLDLVCDDGTLGDTVESRLGSTVIDLSQQGKYKMIRQGW